MQVDLDFWAVLSQWPFLLTGMVWTMGLTAIALIVGFAIGIVCAWARASGPRLLRWPVGAYVELIRNTPFIVQLFFIFFGLPSLGVRLSPEVASVLAMVHNLGAYSTEIIRAGILATPKGQIEAGASLALSGVQVFFYIVLPPSLKRVWPAFVSQCVIVMLGSAVCGQIATEELSYAANVIQAKNFHTFEAYIVVTALYLSLAIGLRRLLSWAGPRFIFGR